MRGTSIKLRNEFRGRDRSGKLRLEALEESAREGSRVQTEIGHWGTAPKLDNL